MAHPIVSFRFADAQPVCFSIEARKVIGQEFSSLASLYRQAQLIYVVADERDSIRVRAVYRPGEDVYLYRTLSTPQQAQERFLEYLHTLNQLHAKPRWYNVLTTNCTTSIREQRPIAERQPWDWRILLNGKADEMLYQRHLIATGNLPFAELKQRSLDQLARTPRRQGPGFLPPHSGRHPRLCRYKSVTEDAPSRGKDHSGERGRPAALFGASPKSFRA